MFNVEVMNRNNAKRYSFQNHDIKSVIVSITDPDRPINLFERNSGNGIVNVLRLQFEDVCGNSPNAITENDAQRIVEFVDKYVDNVDKVIVHCEAGQSRSAGVAAAILKYFTGDDTQIYDNPQYTPNSTCYTKVLQAFFKHSD